MFEGWDMRGGVVVRAAPRTWAIQRGRVSWGAGRRPGGCEVGGARQRRGIGGSTSLCGVLGGPGRRRSRQAVPRHWLTPQAARNVAGRIQRTERERGPDLVYLQQVTAKQMQGGREPDPVRI